MVPQGPPIWISGDCHLGNLGPVASAEGKVEIEIRDLDQTVIGNPAHDLIRLALSLATAARSSDLPGVTTANILEEMIDGYQQGFAHPRATPRKSEITTPVQIALRQALKRRWRHLATERINDVRPTIPVGKRFWPISLKEKKEIGALFGSEGLRKLVTQLHNREIRRTLKCWTPPTGERLQLARPPAVRRSPRRQ